MLHFALSFIWVSRLLWRVTKRNIQFNFTDKFVQGSEKTAVLLHPLRRELEKVLYSLYRLAFVEANRFSTGSRQTRKFTDRNSSRAFDYRQRNNVREETQRATTTCEHFHLFLSKLQLKFLRNLTICPCDTLKLDKLISSPRAAF